ncbi:MAG: hypothetical protein K2G93_08655 [Rikenella sp.]|nr:hypothetical protein [Rikenella sp.]
MYNVGDRGFSWASSFTGTGTYRLYFNSDGIDPNYNSFYLAYGFQTRCLQE